MGFHVNHLFVFHLLYFKNITRQRLAQVTSKLVWDCHQSLIQLARYNRVQLIWVSDHDDIAGNETADLLARIGSEHPFIRPESACGTSIGVAKRAVRDWTKRNKK
jgi:ribonuclease HI